MTERLGAGSLDPQGPAAREMADLWWLMFWLGTAVFVLVVVLLIVGLFRRGTNDGKVGSGGGPWILGGGVILPAVGVTVVFIFTIVAMRAIPTEANSDAPVIEIVGHQWWWEVRYPDQGVVTANEIHFPAGTPVELRLTSADVIHSFWIPSLGGKIDLLPDRVNTMVLEADQPGEFGGACAEFCGLQHAKMRFVAVTESPEDYRRWLNAQQEPAVEPSEDLTRRGQQVFTEAECHTCHTIRGVSEEGTKGPDLTHLASRQTLGAATVPNTPEHLAAWVGDPHRIKEGVKMPDVALAPEDMEALLAYLGSLE